MMATSHAPQVKVDRELADLTEYVCNYSIRESAAFEAARVCVLDSLACALMALDNKDCVRLLGPIVPGAILPGGARVPGTSHELDPATAAFNTGCLIRWLDLNDTFTGASAIHPSDTLAGVLSIADYLSRRPGAHSLLMRDVLTALIKTYEIQGCLALGNKSFGNAGFLDHVFLTKIATAAVVTHMLGGGQEQVLNAASNAWLEPYLRLYRHSHGAGSRKNWAAAHASAQGVRLAYLAMKGEMGYPMALSAEKYGFYDALLGGTRLEFPSPYGCYVIKNSMLKAVPSAMYGQSGAECAFLVHPHIRARLDDIERVTVHVHAGVLRIMDRKGPLRNAADRDHCMQYVIAISLLTGNLHTEDFEDAVASNPDIDALRDKMVLAEDPRFTRDFSDPAKRSSATGIEVLFKGGTALPRVDVEYPSGHPSRRSESFPAFQKKFREALAGRYAPATVEKISSLCANQRDFESTRVDDFMGLLSSSGA